MGKTPPIDRHPDTGFSVSDTPEEVNRFIHQRIMAMEPERRFYMGLSMLATSRELIKSTLSTDLSLSDQRRALYEHLYGEPCPIPHPA